MSIFQKIRELKEKRNYREAWKEGSEHLQQDSNNSYLITSLYHVAYQAIKDIALKVEQRENTYLSEFEREEIDFWVDAIQQLNLGNLNSDTQLKFLLLLFKTKIKVVTRALVNFILVGGSSLFDEDDHKPYALEKGEVPSLVLWLARSVVQYASEYPNQVNAARVNAFARYALTKALDGNSKGKLWLTYDLVAFYLTFSDIDRARDCARQVLRQKKNDGWAWNALGETYREDPEKSLKLYAKAILLAHEDTYKLAALKNMLTIKVADDDKAPALLILNEIIRIYETSNWSLKEDVLKFTRMPWFARKNEPDTLMRLVREWAIGAESLCVENLSTLFGVVSDTHKSGRKVYVYIEKGHELLVERSLFPQQRLPLAGTFLKLDGDFSNNSSLVIKVDLIDKLEIRDVGSFSGNIRISGTADRQLGFVDDVFVPPHLIKNIDHGANVAGLTILAFDKKKNKYGKKAITIQAEQFGN